MGYLHTKSPIRFAWYYYRRRCGNSRSKGNIITSYGEGGPRGSSGAAIFGSVSDYLGMPVTHNDVISGNVLQPEGVPFLQQPQFTKYHKTVMKVFIKSEKSCLHNDDIKWYLADESLWITQYDNYEDIENSIQNSYGSFNWLYEVNDTLLFEKRSGKFMLAVISLSDKIITLGDIEDRGIRETEGVLYLTEKKYSNFEFSNLVYFSMKKDYLCSRIEKSNTELLKLSLSTDFHFFICENELVGWGLKNASRHLQASKTCGKVINEHSKEWLGMYIGALRLWEKDDSNIEALVDLFSELKEYNDVSSVAIKECLNNILLF